MHFIQSHAVCLCYIIPFIPDLTDNSMQQKVRHIRWHKPRSGVTSWRSRCRHGWVEHTRIRLCCFSLPFQRNINAEAQRFPAYVEYDAEKMRVFEKFCSNFAFCFDFHCSSTSADAQGFFEWH